MNQEQEQAGFRRAKLRYMVAARVRSDRAQREVVSAEFGITVSEVDELLLEEAAQDRAGLDMSASAQRARKRKIAQDKAACEARLAKLAEFYAMAGRVMPAHVAAAYRP